MSNAEFTNKFSFATYCEPEICENSHVVNIIDSIHNRKGLKQVCLNEFFY